MEIAANSVSAALLPGLHHRSSKADVAIAAECGARPGLPPGRLAEVQTDGPRERVDTDVRAPSVSSSRPPTGAGGSGLTDGSVKGRAAGHWQHGSFRRAQQAFAPDLGDDRHRFC